MSKRIRILIVDDNLAIHADFDRVLAPPKSHALTLVEAELFGDSVVENVEPELEVHHAFQGAEGVQMLETAARRGLSYDVAFVDVRMPPGIDGVKAISMGRLSSPTTRFILCTAYSDYSLEDAREKIGIRDGLLFLAKPFEAEAVRQFARFSPRAAA